MRFGGFSSYTKFEEAWKGYSAILPLDWPILNIYLSGYNGTCDEFLRRFIPEEIHTKVHHMLTWSPESYWFSGKRRYIRSTPNVVWTVFLALGQAFDIDPNVFVDEVAYYTEYKEKCSQWYYYGIKYHKIPFIAWKQGIALDALIPDYYLNDRSQEARRARFINNTLRPQSGPRNLKADYRIRHILEMTQILGIPFKDLFMQDKRIEVTCYGALSNILNRLPEEDMYLLYAVGEALAASLFKTPEELKTVLCALVDRRGSWKTE